MQSTWFNVRLKAHCMAVLTHLQRMSYDTSSWFYTSASTRCFLYLMSLYIGSKPPEISEHMNFMKIFYVPFFVDILLLVCRAVPLFLLAHRCRSGGPCRYLEHVRQKLRKFSRDLWKKRFQLKKWSFVKIFQPHFELHFFLIFWAESFFKSSQKIFCALYECVQGIYKVCVIQLFASVKKSWPHDIPIKLYVRKSENNWNFEKMKLKMWLEYFDKTSFFELKPFFFKGL